MVAIAELKPSLLISAGYIERNVYNFTILVTISITVSQSGTSGGFKSKGAMIGDTFISTKSVNHDRRIPIPGIFIIITSRYYHNFIHLKGFTEYGVGSQDSTPCPKLIEVMMFYNNIIEL